MQYLRRLTGGKYDGEEDHPPATKKELWGWWWYDWSNSAVSSVIISGFLPLLVQDSAQAAAGFPGICPNLVRNATLAGQLFGSEYSTSYFEAETDVNLLPSSTCVPTPGWFVPTGSLCPGAPGSADDCLLADGLTAYMLRVTTSSGGSWDPAAYTSAMNSLATGLQIFVFISLSGVADFGPHRKRMFTALSLLGCVFCWLCLSVGPSSWEWGGALIVLTSVCYASSYVFYNAWLPLLGANDAAVLAAPAAEQDAVFMLRMHDISSRGYAWGYCGSVVCLIICVGITIAFSGNSLAAYGVNCFVAGCWWFFFSLITFWWLRPRPGPPLPPGESYLTLPWKRMAGTVSRVRQLPQTFGFLLCWFMFADGFNVISSVGAIYANTSVSWQGFPKSLGLAALLLITPIFAGLGNVFWNWVHNRGWMSPKTIMRVNMVLMAAVPAYGLLGFVDRSLGYRRFWELYIGVIVYGFMLGSLQSFSRSAFGAMIPEGLEAQFYALYNVTDRGSSWIGPGVVAAVINSTGTIRLAFVYPVIMLLVPCVLIQFVDFAAAEAAAKVYARQHGTAVLATRGALSVALSGGVGAGGEAEEKTPGAASLGGVATVTPLPTSPGAVDNEAVSLLSSPAV